MEAVKPALIQKTPDIKAFLQKREDRKDELNQEIANLKTKLKDELEKNKEVILYTVEFQETIIFFGEQQKHNFFSHLKFPETGLFLREIEIVHKEHTTMLDLEYENAVVIKFKFNQKEFDGQILLENLGFNDEKMRVSEQITGLGFDPNFVSKEKYFEFKETLKLLKAPILQILKEIELAKKPKA
jgi:hypothetical protein